MTARESIDRLFETIIERQESSFDTIKGINERYYRFVRSMVEATRQGAHDWTNVGRGWAQRPTDIVGLYESASEAISNGQARRIALWQEMLEDRPPQLRRGARGGGARPGERPLLPPRPRPRVAARRGRARAGRQDLAAEPARTCVAATPPEAGRLQVATSGTEGLNTSITSQR
jgi:hypothetical protein